MIGRILKNMRKIRGITQLEIGKKLNFAENTISNYETEYSNPNFNTINDYAKACNFEIFIKDTRTGEIYNLNDLDKDMDF